jgi:hypothetical protein
MYFENVGTRNKAEKESQIQSMKKRRGFANLSAHTWEHGRQYCLFTLYCQIVDSDAQIQFGTVARSASPPMEIRNNVTTLVGFAIWGSG